MKALRLSDLPPELRRKLTRRPRGAGVNALPDNWLERTTDGLLLMERRGASGDDVVLALIPGSVLEELRQAKDVKALR